MIPSYFRILEFIILMYYYFIIRPEYPKRLFGTYNLLWIAAARRAGLLFITIL